VEHLQRVMSWVRSTHPFYNRTGGKDHFFWLANDQGGCWIPPDDPLLAAPAKIVHFGFHGWNTKLPGDYQVNHQQQEGLVLPSCKPQVPVSGSAATHAASCIMMHVFGMMIITTACPPALCCCWSPI
jgi:hypothetical protein